MSTEDSKFAAARVSDIVAVTNGKGQQCVEIDVEVGGNSEEAVEHLVNRFGQSAKALGIEFEVEDDTRGKRSSNSKSFVSNWGSGSAWKNAGQN